MTIIRSMHEVSGEKFTVLIEMDGKPANTDAYGATRGAASKVLDSARDYFGDGMTLARACAASAVTSLSLLAEDVRPQEFELKLAIKLDAEAGAMLAKLGAEAQLEVTLKWTKSKA
jgi:hypothetical protein